MEFKLFETGVIKIVNTTQFYSETRLMDLSDIFQVITVDVPRGMDLDDGMNYFVHCYHGGCGTNGEPVRIEFATKEQRDELMSIIEIYLASKNGDEIYQLKNILKQLESIGECVLQINEGLQALVYAPGGIAESALKTDFQLGESVQSYLKNVEDTGDARDVEDVEDTEDAKNDDKDDEEWVVSL